MKRKSRSRQLELGKGSEPWDLCLMPAPENPPLRMLLIEKADRATEAGLRTAQQKTGLSRLKTEMEIDARVVDTDDDGLPP
jgi:hypothetical protein